MSYGNYGKELDPLVGKKITEVWFSPTYLTFVTSTGENLNYTVYGDCCSSSEFNDFVGLQKLLDNGPVISWNEIGLNPEETDRIETVLRGRPDEYVDSLQFYGYALITESPVWGEQTTVFSFRNNSNGYYGGSLEGPYQADGFHESQRRLTEDLVVS